MAMDGPRERGPCLQLVTCSELRKEQSEDLWGVCYVLGAKRQPYPNLTFSTVAAVCLSLGGYNQENLSSRGSTPPFLTHITDHQAVPC